VPDTALLALARDAGSTAPALSIRSHSPENPRVSDIRQRPPTSSHLPPLALWLSLQFIALLPPTLHIPLSDNFPRPIERLALDEMLIVQITAAALLFPMLFKTVSTTAALVACTWPFLQLAAILSATPVQPLLLAALYLAMWMTALALINSALHGNRARMRAVTLATSFTLAGPLLSYLSREFASNDRAPKLITALNPLLCALRISRNDKIAPLFWAFSNTLLALSLIVSALLHRRRAMPDKLSTNPPHALPTRPPHPPNF
jgi:hypothetical protein